MSAIVETRADGDKKKAFLRPEAEARKRLQQKLQQMQEGSKREKEEREAAERRKEEIVVKLRARLGVDTVTSRLHGPPPKEEKEPEEKSRAVLPPIAAEAAPDAEEVARKRAEVAQRNKAILEKNQQFLAKLAEKRREEEEALELVRNREEQLRRRLKEKVLEAVEAQRQQEGAGVAAGGEAPGGKGGKERGDGPAEPDSPKRSEIEKAIQNRVKRHQDRFGSEAEEEAWLRKKYGFADSDKLFNIPSGPGSYQAIREALAERGWREHREDESLVFDLKWTVKTSDIPFKALDREQIVNHFARNGSVTTKVGLTRNLRNLKWFEDVDMDEFFPRSYDLHDHDELLDFVDDFRLCAAEGLLRRFLADGPAVTDQQGRPLGAEYAAVVQLACMHVDAHLRRCKVIDIDSDDSDGLALTPDEWSAILGEPCPAVERRPALGEAAAAAMSKRQRAAG